MKKEKKKAGRNTARRTNDPACEGPWVLSRATFFRVARVSSRSTKVEFRTLCVCQCQVNPGGVQKRDPPRMGVHCRGCLRGFAVVEYILRSPLSVLSNFVGDPEKGGEFRPTSSDSLGRNRAFVVHLSRVIFLFPRFYKFLQFSTDRYISRELYFLTSDNFL